MTIAKVTTSPYFRGVGMTKEKAKEVVKEVEKVIEIPKYIDRPVYTPQI